MLIVQSFACGPVLANTYIFKDSITNNAYLIDPSEITAPLRTALADCHIRMIFLTHAHYDHMLAIDEARDLTGAPLAMSAEDAPALLDPALNLTARFDVPRTFRPADRILHHGDLISDGNFKIKIMATPGHTPGSLCYLSSNRILFSGDTLFYESVGRTDLPGGNVESLKSSICALMGLASDWKVYPGHGDSTTVAHERLYNFFYPQCLPID